MNIEKDNKENIVNNLIKEYNLDDSYYEPILNLIENSIDILNIFDTTEPIKNRKKEQKDLNRSSTIDLIKKCTYKKYLSKFFQDIDKIDNNKNINFSYDYKNNKLLY